MYKFENFDLNTFMRFYFVNKYKDMFSFDFILFLEIDYKSRMKIISNILNLNLNFFFLNSTIIKSKIFDAFLKFLRHKNLVVFTNSLVFLKPFLNYLKQFEFADSFVFCFNKCFLNLSLDNCLAILDEHCKMQANFLHLLNIIVYKKLSILCVLFYFILFYIQYYLHVISLKSKWCII